ncbi:unnamed protein product [Discula destructiva]
MAGPGILSKSRKDESSLTKGDIAIETNETNNIPADENLGEKAVHVIDGVNVIGLSEDDFNHYQMFTPQMRKKLNRKIDVRLIPILGMLYLVSNLDRVNIGNAKIEGMDKDLN